jgi:hypothetical protein
MLKLGFGDQELEKVQFSELGLFRDLRIEEKVENDLETVRKGIVEKYPLMPYTKAKLALYFMMGKKLNTVRPAKLLFFRPTKTF